MFNLLKLFYSPTHCSSFNPVISYSFLNHIVGIEEPEDERVELELYAFSFPIVNDDTVELGEVAGVSLLDVVEVTNEAFNLL